MSGRTVHNMKMHNQRWLTCIIQQVHVALRKVHLSTPYKMQLELNYQFIELTWIHFRLLFFSSTDKIFIAIQLQSVCGDGRCCSAFYSKSKCHSTRQKSKYNIRSIIVWRFEALATIASDLSLAVSVFVSNEIWIFFLLPITMLLTSSVRGHFHFKQTEWRSNSFFHINHRSRCLKNLIISEGGK